MLLLLTACLREEIDLEATCAELWPPDDCGAGDCVDGDEQRWADAFDEAFAAGAGIVEGDVPRYARLRTFEDSEAGFQSVSSGAWQLDVDWMRVVVPVEVWADTATPSDDALVAAWRERLRVPAFDLDAPLASFSDVLGFVEECEETHDVTFDAEGWCEPYYGTDPDDDDPTGLRVDLRAQRDDGGQVQVSVSLVPGGERSCETVQPLQ